MKNADGTADISRRHLVVSLAGGLAAAPFGAAHAQAYPSKPIRWVIGYAAGGGIDMVARLLAESMSKSLGQPIVIDNRPGAAGMIAAGSVATAPADGYTLLSLDVGMYALNPNLYAKVPYNSARDFTIGGMQVAIPFVLFADASLPVNNTAEFVAYVKARPPGSLHYASTGLGGPVHLAMELLQEQAKLQLTHVPYKSAPAMIGDLLSGQVPFAFSDAASSMQFVKSGKLKAIAVTTAKRLDPYPDLPTFLDAGYDVQIQSWVCLATPAGVQRATIDKLNEALTVALREPEIAKRLAGVGFSVSTISADEANAFARRQLAFWEAFLKPRNIRVD